MEIWIIAPLLMVLMQAGFGLTETGLGRAKNAAHTMSLNFLVYALGITAFWAIGFALMFGGAGSPQHAFGSWGHLGEPTGFKSIWGLRIAGHWCGFIGGRGFFLAGRGLDPAGIRALATVFLTMMLYMTVAVSIPTGALIERWSVRSFSLFALINAGVLFPVFGCWMWGGGWLAALGHHFGLGNGAVDYAGSAVVHLFGGTVALAGVLRLGPRIGKYGEAGNPRPIFGHQVPMVLYGTLLLAFAWFGFNMAQSLAMQDGRAAIIAVNTALASAAGALAAGLYMTFMYGKPDPSLMCNGMLGALVASSAGCAYIDPWAAFLIGAVAGVVAPFGVLTFERHGIDDPVGAISVHGLNGLWGMIALGLFANGTAGAGTHLVSTPVTGLFYGGGGKQLLAQLIASAACIAWAFGAASAAFMILRSMLGSNRVSVEAEIAGLDIPEMGASGYPEFINQMGPEQVPMSEIIAARRG